MSSTERKASHFVPGSLGYACALFPSLDPRGYGSLKARHAFDSVTRTQESARIPSAVEPPKR